MSWRTSWRKEPSRSPAGPNRTSAPRTTGAEPRPAAARSWRRVVRPSRNSSARPRVSPTAAQGTIANSSVTPRSRRGAEGAPGPLRQPLVGARHQVGPGAGRRRIRGRRSSRCAKPPAAARPAAGRRRRRSGRDPRCAMPSWPAAARRAARARRGCGAAAGGWPPRGALGGPRARWCPASDGGLAPPSSPAPWGGGTWAGARSTHACWYAGSARTRRGEPRPRDYRWKIGRPSSGMLSVSTAKAVLSSGP